MIQYIEISDDDSDGQSPPFENVVKDPPPQHIHHFGTPPDEPLFGRGRIMEPAIRDGAAVEPRASAMLEPYGAHSFHPLLGMRQADWDEEDQEMIRVFMGGLPENHRISKPGGPSALGQENKVVESPRKSEVTEAECINRVLAIFGDISVDYVSNLYNQISKSPDNLVAHILDQMDKGANYPRAEDPKKKLKRKRVVDEEKEAILKYDTADRIVPPAAYAVRQETRRILSLEFADVPMSFIDTTLNNSGYRLFSAYIKLEETQRTLDPTKPAYNKNKSRRKMPQEYQAVNLDAKITAVETDPHVAEVWRELQAARKLRKTVDVRRQVEREKQLLEEENESKAIAEGTMSECGCCFGDYPLNRMVHCDSDKVLHWFCRGCARQMASTAIGSSKYQLQCMSTEGCEAGFSVSQRNQFLDESAISALERNEAKAVLLMADIKDLATCPFCEYAAEYPPVEENREFYCLAPDCQKISCRMCRLESHIPKTCKEHARDNGLSALRQVEEAMSAALIRKCNKCSAPFVKEDGCNKMTCSSCRNIQCYVCSESLPPGTAYNHFDEQSRGGKAGNCPLFESVEERHKTDVGKAEKEALEKLRAEHPEVGEEILKMADNLSKQDKRRKPRDAPPPPPAGYPFIPALPRQRVNFELHNNGFEGQFQPRQNLIALPVAANQPAYQINPPANLPVYQPPEIGVGAMEQLVFQNMAGPPGSVPVPPIRRVRGFGHFLSMSQQENFYPLQMEGIEYENPPELPAVPPEEPEAGFFGPPESPLMIRIPRRRRLDINPKDLELTPWEIEARQYLRGRKPPGAPNVMVPPPLPPPPPKPRLPRLPRLPSVPSLLPLSLLSPLPKKQNAEGSKRPRNVPNHPTQVKNNPVELRPGNRHR